MKRGVSRLRAKIRKQAFLFEVDFIGRGAYVGKVNTGLRVLPVYARQVTELKGWMMCPGFVLHRL